MQNKDERSAVNFQSEAGNVEFQPETGEGGGGLTERIGEAAQNVNWGKVGVGVGAAAAVAGAAYAASKIVGRGSNESESASGSSNSSGSSGRGKS
ncbi:MAG TPA: hypothetical protein VF702_15090 [Allosphingosinicella sp.]